MWKGIDWEPDALLDGAEVMVLSVGECVTVMYKDRSMVRVGLEHLSRIPREVTRWIVVSKHHSSWLNQRGASFDTKEKAEEECRGFEIAVPVTVDMNDFDGCKLFQ